MISRFSKAGFSVGRKTGGENEVGAMAAVIVSQFRKHFPWVNPFEFKRGKGILVWEL
jgi:hypothetical protein